MATTWVGTAGNQLVTGAALTTGALTGYWVMTGTVPTNMLTKIMTKANIATYTNFPTGNSPLGFYPSNYCPTKDTMLACL